MILSNDVFLLNQSLFMMNSLNSAKLANLNTELLRSFVTVVEQDGFIRASEYLYKTQSTISQHIQRLEQELDTVLFMPIGRKRTLTPTGEIFLGYAKRLLALQQEAQLAVAQTHIQGEVRIGLSRSLGEHLIPDLLSEFTRYYPAVRLFIDTGYSTDLLQAYHQGLYDLILTLELKPSEGTILGNTQMVWIGRQGYEWDQHQPLALAAYAPPCQFREMCTQVLDQAGIAWQLAFNTNSLNSLMSAVRLGLAVTVRTSHTLVEDTEILTPRLALPKLPALAIVLHNRNITEAENLLTEILGKQTIKAA